jgi:hypothetical protein
MRHIVAAMELADVKAINRQYPKGIKDAKEREGKTLVCERHEPARINRGLSLKFIRAIRA